MRLSKKHRLTFLYGTHTLTILVAFTAIIGWISPYQSFTEPIPHAGNIKLLTSICLLFIGVLGIVSMKNMTTRKVHWVSKSLAFVVAIVGVFSCIENLTDTDLINQNVFCSWCTNLSIGRMGIISSVAFMTFGGYYYFLDSSDSPLKKVFHYLTQGTGFVALVAIIGYSLDVPSLYQFSFKTYIALPTSILLFLQSIAVTILNPEIGIFAVYFGRKSVNRNVRRLAFSLISFSIAIVSFAIWLDKKLAFSHDFGFIVLGISLVMVILVSIAINGGKISELTIKAKTARDETYWFSALFNAHPDAMFLVKKNGEILYTNSKAENITGYLEHQIRKFTLFNLLQINPSIFQQLHDESIASQSPLTQISESFIKVGQKKGVRLELTVSLFQQKENTYFALSARDISERDTEFKRLQHVSEVVENSSDGIVSLELDGTIITWNKGAELIFGFSSKDRIGSSITELIPLELMNESAFLLEKVQHGESLFNIETQRICKNGAVVDVNITLSPIISQNGEVLGVSKIIRDVTKQKKELSEKARLEKILDRSSEVAKIGTWEVDVLNKKASWSDTARGIFELSESFELKPETISNYFKKGPDYDRLMQNIQIATIEGRPYDIEIQIYVNTDQTKWIRIIGESEFVNDVCVRRYGIFQDVTDTKENEAYLKKSNLEMTNLLTISREQNDRLNNFAHIVSHNLLTHSGNYEMILDLLLFENPELKLSKTAEMLALSTHKLKETIDNLNQVVLLNTAEKSDLVPLNLHECLNAAIVNSQLRAEEKGVQISSSIPENLIILGIPAYLDSVLLNLITNGIKYRNSNVASIVHFSTEIVHDKVFMSVKDNGKGIDLKKYGSKVFGMYKTFHRHNDARGIGLFMTKNQMEAMGGSIQVESTPGIGSTFTLQFNHYVH